MFNKEYRLLTQEGHLTMSSILNGLDCLSKANIDDNHRGLFYSGLFELSIGIERLFKIVLILNHKIENQCKTPTNNELRAFGHDIERLFIKCSECTRKYNIPDLSLNDKQQSILSVLAKFAKGSRYYNLDELTENNKNDDPISLWLEVINDHVWSLRSDVRLKLETEALKFVGDNRLENRWKQNINGEWITYCDFYFLLMATEKANKHIIWSIIQILYPFYHILGYQVQKVHEFDSASHENEIPFMYEFFSFFLTSKESTLRKKQWVWGH